MTNTPLQLEDYFFNKILIQSNPEFSKEEELEGGEGSEGGFRAKVNLETLQNNQDETKFQLNLKIGGFEGVNGQQPPYDIELEVVGLFTVSASYPEEKVLKLVQINGASILYSAAREFVLMITGRGQWGSFTIPTTNFSQAVQENEQKGNGE